METMAAVSFPLAFSFAEENMFAEKMTNLRDLKMKIRIFYPTARKISSHFVGLMSQAHVEVGELKKGMKSMSANVLERLISLGES